MYSDDDEVDEEEFELDESVHDADSTDGMEDKAKAATAPSRQAALQAPAVSPPTLDAGAYHGGGAAHNRSTSNYSMSFDDEASGVYSTPHPPAAASPPGTPSPKHQRNIKAHAQSNLPSPTAVRQPSTLGPQQSRPPQQQYQHDNSYSSDFDAPGSPGGSQHSSISGSFQHFSPRVSASINNAMNTLKGRLPSSSVPSEIHSMRDIVRRIVSHGAGDRETRMLEKHLCSLQAGLQEIKLRKADEQRRRRVAAQEKKARAEARRFKHIEALAEANKRAAAAEYQSKKLGSEVEELRRLVDMSETEAAYAKEALDATERAKAAADKLVQERDRELREEREERRAQEEGLRQQLEQAEGRARRLEVEADKARARWELDAERMEEVKRAEVERARAEGKDVVDGLQLARQRLELEVEVLRNAQERQERRHEEEKRSLPQVHKELLQKEEARLKRLEQGLEEERAALDCERARFLQEMEAWRRKMDEEERQTRARVAGAMEDAKREREADRKALEDERRSSRQELMVLEMKAEQAQAAALREKAAAEKERQRLAEESAVLAVRAGLLAPQLQEMDRAYAELEAKKKEADRRDQQLSQDKLQLDQAFTDLGRREKAVKEGLEELARHKREGHELRRERKALHVARLELHEAFVQLSRQSHEVRRAVAMLRRITTILPTPDPLCAGEDEEEAYNYGSLVDAVVACIEDAGAIRLPRGLVAPLTRAAARDHEEEGGEEEEGEAGRQLVAVSDPALAWGEEQGQGGDVSFGLARGGATARAGKGPLDKTEELLPSGREQQAMLDEEGEEEDVEVDEAGHRGPPSASPPRARARRRRHYGGERDDKTAPRLVAYPSPMGGYGRQQQHREAGPSRHMEQEPFPLRSYVQGLAGKDLGRSVSSLHEMPQAGLSPSSASSWRLVLQTEEDQAAQAMYRKAASALSDKVEALRAAAVTTGGGATTLTGSAWHYMS